MSKSQTLEEFLAEVESSFTPEDADELACPYTPKLVALVRELKSQRDSREPVDNAAIAKMSNEQKPDTSERDRAATQARRDTQMYYLAYEDHKDFNPIAAQEYERGFAVGWNARDKEIAELRAQLTQGPTWTQAEVDKLLVKRDKEIEALRAELKQTQEDKNSNDLDYMKLIFNNSGLHKEIEALRAERSKLSNELGHSAKRNLDLHDQLDAERARAAALVEAADYHAERCEFAGHSLEQLEIALEAYKKGEPRE